MSVQLLDEVRLCSSAPPAARAVLMMIAFHHHHEDPTRTIELDAEQLADEVGCRRSQLYEHLKTLYGLGELVKLEGGGGRGKVTRWRVPALTPRESGGRWRTPAKVNARPLVATAKPSGIPDAIGVEIPSGNPDGLGDVNRPENRPENSPGSRTDPSRVNAVGVKAGEEKPPLTPPASWGGTGSGSHLEGLKLRALGTNPRALARQAAEHETVTAAEQTAAAMRHPDQADEDDWHAFLASLRATVSETPWNLHLASLALVAVEPDGTFILAGAHEWVGGRYGRPLRACARHVGRPGARMATAPELAALQRAA